MTHRTAALAFAGLFPLLTGCMTSDADETRRYSLLPAQPEGAYEPQLGGPDTISLSIMDCAGTCKVVNVLLDPDNYWQRTADDGAYSGIAPGDLYASVMATFDAQGFDGTESTLDITRANPEACPQYLVPGRTWFIHLGRGETGQSITYDTACTGSAEVQRAKKATEALAELSALSHIFAGRVTVEGAMDDEE